MRSAGPTFQSQTSSIFTPTIHFGIASEHAALRISAAVEPVTVHQRRTASRLTAA